MKIDAPLLLILLIGIGLGIASVASHFYPVPYISGHAYEALLLGFGVVIFGLVFRSKN